jgi:hypothetical protein
MGVVSYRCPTTNEDVTTAIETGHDTLFRMKLMSMKIWVWCPHCMAGHQIRPSEAILQEEDVLTAAGDGIALR